jgi:probable rRNA maturation factor
MIEINNLSNFKVDEKILKKALEIVLKGELIRKREVSVALVDPEEIKRINFEYRKKKEVTDVLSFGFSEKNFLGEIIICPLRVEENAKKINVSFQEEIIRVLVHGALHLMGFDHEGSAPEAEKMRRKERKYLNKISTFYGK